MTEAEWMISEAGWLAATNPDDLINYLIGKSGLDYRDDGGPLVPEGAVSNRKLCLYYCACHRTVWSAHSDRDREAIVMLEEKAEQPLYTTDQYGYGDHRALLLGEDRALQAAKHAVMLRDVLGNPFRPAVLDPTWRTSTVVSISKTMYDSRDFSPMPILADALQDAGCENEDILNHCRSGGPHVRGCWVVDLILGKE